jgi:hypothetical protein
MQITKAHQLSIYRVQTTIGKGRNGSISELKQTNCRLRHNKGTLLRSSFRHRSRFKAGPTSSVVLRQSALKIYLEDRWSCRIPRRNGIPFLLHRVVQNEH